MESKQFIKLIKDVFNRPDGELLLEELKDRFIYHRRVDTADTNQMYLDLGKGHMVIFLDEVAKLEAVTTDPEHEYETGIGEEDDD